MAFTLATVEGFAPDWTTLGYLLALVGCFLLANGILFRNPRALVSERLGRGPQPLRRIREFVFHRVQMGLGFLFLVGAFASLLYAHLRPPTEPGGSVVMWVGLVLVLAAVLEVAGWLWSAHSLRAHVRVVLRQTPPDFETDPTLAREVGELFGIESRSDETVQSYAARLRQSLGLASGARSPARPRTQPDTNAIGFGEEAGFEDS